MTETGSWAVSRKWSLVEQNGPKILPCGLQSSMQMPNMGQNAEFDFAKCHSDECFHLFVCLNVHTLQVTISDEFAPIFFMSRYL